MQQARKRAHAVVAAALTDQMERLFEDLFTDDLGQADYDRLSQAVQEIIAYHDKRARRAAGEPCWYHAELRSSCPDCTAAYRERI